MFPNELFHAELQEGFREPIRRGRFVGRERELDRLREIIQERDSATVLVAGFRGAGKTSLVAEAVNRSDAVGDRLVIRIAPPHLGEAVGVASIRSQILRSLARGLYFAVSESNARISKEVRGRVEAAYEKTYLTELERHSVVESIASAARTTQETKLVRSRLELDKPVRLLVGATVMGFVATLGVGAAALVADRFGIWWGLGAAVAILAASILSGVSIERSTTDSSEDEETLTKKDARTELGKFDLSDETLEFELQSALEGLAKKFRVVFILDELDKLDWVWPQQGDELERSAIFTIVTSLKNFFSLSNAVYIFITDQAFFERVALQAVGKEYHLAHTIFTDRIYVGPLHYVELEALIDQSLVKTPESAEFDKFKNYVCWESNNHAFDALQVLGAFVETTNGKHWLAPTTSGQHEGVYREGNLPSSWEKRAALQKHVGVAFDDARRTGLGEDLFNQALWESLRLVAEGLLDGDGFLVPNEWWMSDVPGNFVASLGEADRERVNQAAERMLRRLERHKAATQTEATMPWEADDGTTTEVEATRYTLNQSVPYPPSTIADEQVLLPAERLLVETVARLDALIAANDGKVPTAEDSELTKRLRAMVAQLKRTGPRRVTPRRSEVAGAIPQASDLAQRVSSAAVRREVDKWAAEIGAVVATSIGIARKPNETWAQSLAQDFSPLVDAIGATEAEVLLLSGGANEYGLMVVLLADDDDAERLQQGYSACLDDDDNSRAERRQRLPIVMVGIDSSKAVAFPEELVEIYREVKPKGILERWFTRTHKQRSTKTQKLEGWTHFPLRDSLDNLPALSETLTKASFLRAA